MSAERVMGAAVSAAPAITGPVPRQLISLIAVPDFMMTG